MICKKVPEIVRGHEIWLEHNMRHLLVGETVECNLLFGHNMKVDGKAVLENVKATVFDSANEKRDLVVDAGDNCLIARFTPEVDGHHTVAVEYDAGIYTVTDEGWQKGPKSNYENVKSSAYYSQFAKIILPVRWVPYPGTREAANVILPAHERKEYKLETGQELEIIPLEFRHFHVGHDITLKILYEGRVLQDAMIIATYSGLEGKIIETKTDAEGKATFKFEKEGNWFFKVRHSDPEKGVKDQYDEKVITAVLTVMKLH